MSVGTKASTTTTCASETDEYETSSEGAVRNAQEKRTGRSKNSRRMGSARDEENSSTKEDKLEESSDSQKTVCPSSVLMKSESMPLLRSASSREENSDEGNVAVGSESSLARQKKMKMIVARMGSLLSSESNLTVNSSANASKADLTDENYEARKLESKTELPVLQDAELNQSSCSKEVTFWEVLDNKESIGRLQSSNRERNMSFQNSRRIIENPQESQADDDLIDIAENPYPSIKSFYFPPNPQEKEGPSMCPRKQPRVTKDVEALLRIDGELGPLQHKLTEITSKFRAMNMTVPSLLSQRHCSNPGAYSSNVSGYYLHRAETFGRGSNINDVVYVLGNQAPTFVDRSSRESRGPNHVETLPFHSFNNDTVSLNHDLYPVKEALSRSTNVGHRYSSKCVDKSISNVTNDWPVRGNNSCVTLQNSFVHLGGYSGNNPSGTLIPTANSSCYKCFKNRALDFHAPNTSFYNDQLEAVRSRNNFTRKSSITHFPDESGLCRNIESPVGSNDYKDYVNSRYSGAAEFVNINRKSQLAGSDGYAGTSRYEKDHRQRASKKFPESNASTSTSPDIRVISVNRQLCATVEKHYTDRIVAGGNSYFKEASKVHQSSMRSPESFENDKHNSHCSRDQSISTSLTVIGSDGSNKTHYVNYTRVGSQTSLIISKKCQSTGTSSPEQTENSLTRSSTHLVAKNEGSECEKERKVQDLDVQCSGFDLNYHRNETLLRRSIESLLKPTVSEESNTSQLITNKTRRIQAPKAEEKVIIVPILFTDGIPEPSRVPLINFTKSKHCLHKTSHRVVKLEKAAPSLTHSSVLSRTSAESCTMESYLSQGLMNRDHWHSGMSVSCISHGKTPSQLSNTINTLSERSRRTGRVRRPDSAVSGSTYTNKACSEPMKRGTRRLIQGMRSSPEDFLSDT